MSRYTEHELARLQMENEWLRTLDQGKEWERAEYLVTIVVHYRSALERILREESEAGELGVCLRMAGIAQEALDSVKEIPTSPCTPTQSESSEACVRGMARTDPAAEEALYQQQVEERRLWGGLR